MDNFQDENKIDFSTPTLSQEQIDKYLQRIYQNPEESDPELAYCNNNRFTITQNIKKGIIDSQILMYGDILTNFINDGFNLEYYSALVQQYCSANGIDYEHYKLERQKIIDEIARNSTSPTPVPDTTIVQKEEITEHSEAIENSEKNIFLEPSISIEQVNKYLQRAYQNPEEPDPEIGYCNNNRSTIKKNIEKGIIDPQVLRFGNILTDFITDGFDLNYYESFLPEYCSAQGIDFEQYMTNRQHTIDSIAAPIPPNNDFTFSDQESENEEYEKHEEHETYDFGNYENEETLELDTNDCTEFLQKTAQIAEQHPAIKQNWLEKMKVWMKENIIKPIQKYFNKDER